MPINPTKRDTVGPAAGEVIGVIDTEGDRAAWTFPAEPGAVRTARQAVRGQLRGWGLDSLADLTALLVSELVTNALRHARGPIGVRLVRPSELNAVLLVEVSDPLPDPPRERAARPEDESGRGLYLVATSCRRWGTRPGGVGKTVWFELAVPE
ncbi:ATP-binding protein [Streptomyces afghaniensis]|uniref:ATP-binding protein n=1 Tax=Streptomyces TaxID=1883 RepID=UPI001FAF0796|nr:ATP-binding protein [Streptomyces sp. HP-A2021]UOB10468.1 ATP-binding protein [Streptomyces sp. HP-A2021]